MDKEAREAKEAGNAALFIVALFLFTQLLNNFVFNYSGTMRSITRQSAEAFMNAERFKKGNMEVEVLPNVTVLKLFGNSIAYRYNDPERTLSITNCGWDTPTTKERLNALPNVSIQQVNREWFLNGEKWNGNLIDVKS